jgi:hypothetical protein
VKWVDEQLGRLVSDHAVGDLAASVAEFLKLDDPTAIAGVKHQQDLIAGWGHCRQYVGNCNTGAVGGAG